MIQVEGKPARTADEFRDLFYKAVRREAGGEVNDYTLEMRCFRDIPLGHPFKYHFCLSGMQMQWDSWLQLQVGPYENYWFKRIIWHACRERWLWLMGAASSGKSFGAAAYIYTVWKANCFECSSIVSSTSRDALQQRIWGIIKKMHTLDRFKMGNRLDYRDMIVLQEDKNDKDRFYENSIAAVALPKGSEGEKAIGEIQGRKNVHVIWAADELSHMDGQAIRTARGNLNANRNFQFFGLSNKPEEGDAMYMDAEPIGADFPQGWNTVGLDSKKTWPTKMGKCLYFDGTDSPNMKAPESEEPPFPMLTTRRFIEDTIKDDGMEDGPQFWRWVKGFPKAGDIRDRVMTPAIIETFGATKQVVWAGNSYEVVAGLDLGLKADGDPCVAAFAKVGEEHEGDKVMACEPETIQLPHSMSDSTPYDQQVARKFVKECQERNCHKVAADISGGGGLMTQAIAQQAISEGYRLDIIPVDFGGTPSDELYEVGGDKKPARQLFDRKVTELWYSFRLAVQNRKVRGMNLASKYVKQLCERRVIQDEQRRWKVEKKADMKKRTKRSPDDGDAQCLCHVAARSAGLSKDTSLLSEPVQRTHIIRMGDEGEEARGRYQRQHTKRRTYMPR